MSGSAPPPDGGGYGPPPPPGGGGYGSAPPPPPPGYGPGPGGYGQAPGSNKKAIWALVLGILGILCCGILGIPAIILGKQAQGEIDSSGGMQSGRGLATAGFVLGIIACIWLVVAIILYATGALTLNFDTN